MADDYILAGILGALEGAQKSADVFLGDVLSRRRRREELEFQKQARLEELQAQVPLQREKARFETGLETEAFKEREQFKSELPVRENPNDSILGSDITTFAPTLEGIDPDRKYPKALLPFLRSQTGEVALYDQDGNVTGYVPKGARPAPKPTDTQSTTGLYANRIEQSDAIITGLESYSKEVNPLSFAAQKELPDVATKLKSKEFQSLEQAQKNFVNAVLRKESGAVINPSEFVEAQKQYFPIPGDSDETIEQKRLNRKLVLEQFKNSAGIGYKRSGFITAPEDKKSALRRKLGLTVR